ncbi:MAG: hypothetical protein K2X29_05620, partial [Candidatus Obscuribacterales bacterium]|nr:hypothetical protein [Candidatus Obscuribacterales bacterium]
NFDLGSNFVHFSEAVPRILIVHPFAYFAWVFEIRMTVINGVIGPHGKRVFRVAQMASYGSRVQEFLFYPRAITADGRDC